MIKIRDMTTDEIENFDYSSLSESEKANIIRELTDEAAIKGTLEQSNKLVLNSIYGSMASIFFYFYNKSLAETITGQGQDAIRYAERAVDSYFQNILHKDKFILNKLKEICPDVNVTPEPCVKPTVVYIDTDSVDKDTIISTNKGNIRIEDLYNENSINAGGTKSGHESVETNRTVLNWSETNGLYQAPVKRIIRHKVSKAKWKLKTKSGKEVTVTNDHSMIVFRNGVKIEVKPSEILKTDKILSIR